MDALRVRTSDVALTTVVTVVLLVAMFAIGRAAEGDARAFDVLAGVLVSVAGGVSVLHRRAPMVVLAVVTAALVLYGLRDYPGGPVYLTWIGAIFAVSVARGPARAWLPAAASTVLVVVTAFHGHSVGSNLPASEGSTGLVAALFVSWAAGALLLGGSVRGRRAERAVMEERTRHLTETRETEARRRVAEERVRIARDLHDSVAHSLASVSVQAGVGAHVLGDRPADARAALLAIKSASDEALTELRATLGMLRSGPAADREPETGLERLPSLVERSGAAGLPVDVVFEGEVRPLPLPVDVAAFRIVQESLTNVIRHAGPTRATVAVRHGDSAVEIEVTDDGRGPFDGHDDADGGDGGHGLAGMRERATLLGGELHSGPRPSGGYRVWARLPL